MGRGESGRGRTDGSGESPIRPPSPLSVPHSVPCNTSEDDTQHHTLPIMLALPPTSWRNGAFISRPFVCCTLLYAQLLMSTSFCRYPFDFHTQGPFLFHIVSFHTKSYEHFYFHTLESSFSILFWSQPFYFYTNSEVTTLTNFLWY